MLYVVSDDAVTSRLSPEEERFATRFAEVYRNHIANSFLSQLPPPLRRIPPQMSLFPSLFFLFFSDRLFVCRFGSQHSKAHHLQSPRRHWRLSHRHVRADSSFLSPTHKKQNRDEAVPIDKGHVLIMRYEPIKSLLREKQIDLI